MVRIPNPEAYLEIRHLYCPAPNPGTAGHRARDKLHKSDCDAKAVLYRDFSRDVQMMMDDHQRTTVS